MANVLTRHWLYCAMRLAYILVFPFVDCELAFSFSRGSSIFLYSFASSMLCMYTHRFLGMILIAELHGLKHTCCCVVAHNPGTMVAFGAGFGVLAFVARAAFVGFYWHDEQGELEALNKELNMKRIAHLAPQQTACQ